MNGLTPDEIDICNVLAGAYVRFIGLERLHPMEVGAFVDAIHRAQTLVMARAAVRAHPDLFGHGTEGVTDD